MSRNKVGIEAGDGAGYGSMNGRSDGSRSTTPARKEEGERGQKTQDTAAMERREL